MLYLTENDVRELLDMETAIDVVEEAFRQLAAGKAVNVPRVRAGAPGILLHTMSATAEYLGLVGYKAYTTTRSSARFHVVVCDAASGEPLAWIEADFLGQLRTGAASGVATEYMARPDARIVGLLGAGKQACTQLKAVCCVRRVERVEVYCRHEERRTQFAREMSEFCGTQVVPVHSPDEAAAEKDIVITATSSSTPVFDGRVLDEGTHLNVIGSNFRHKAEIDLDTIRRADHIVCDSVEQCQLEAGDFFPAIEAGVLEWPRVHNLADVVTGLKTGRAVPQDVTLFKSVGLAIEDLALAGRLLQRARAEGLGTEWK